MTDPPQCQHALQRWTGYCAECGDWLSARAMPRRSSPREDAVAGVLAAWDRLGSQAMEPYFDRERLPRFFWTAIEELRRAQS